MRSGAVPQSPAAGTSGVVSSPHWLASEAGAEILRRGGNAVEAAIAVSSTLAVVYPHMNGLGGDGYWLVSDGRSGSVQGIAAAGPAGRGYHTGVFPPAGRTGIPFRGGLAALTVPGVAGGWDLAYAHSRENWGGRLSWDVLLDRAMGYAASGFPVSASQCRALRDHAGELEGQPGFARHFLRENRLPPGEGTVWAQPDLARSLRMIAGEGPQVFYQGRLARAMVQGLQRAGSRLVEEDLQAYRARWVSPLRVRFGRGELLNLPPPTQGVASLMIAAVLDRMDVHRLPPLGAEFVHLAVEVTKQVFRYRDALVADPDFQGMTVEHLLTDLSLERCARSIDRESAACPPPGGPATGDTAWFGVVDASGRMVSAIQSLYHEFGTGVVAGDTGIVWNNRGCAFSLETGHANVLAPGKRPFHTLNPAMYAEDGQVRMAYGTMGGDGQPQTQAAVLFRARRYGWPLAEAISAPRWLYGRTWGEPAAGLRLESRYGRDVAETLQRWGHAVTWVEPYSDLMGHAGALACTPDGCCTGAADPRSDGAAVAAS